MKPKPRKELFAYFGHSKNCREGWGCGPTCANKTAVHLLNSYYQNCECENWDKICQECDAWEKAAARWLADFQKRNNERLNNGL